jgi:hypothetical protein
MNLTLFMEWTDDEVWQQKFVMVGPITFLELECSSAESDIWAIQVEFYDEIHSLHTSVPACNLKPFWFFYFFY